MRRMALALICGLLSGPALGAAGAAPPVSSERVDLRGARDPSAASPGAPESGAAVAATEALAPDLAPVDLQGLRDTVDYYNMRANLLAGVDLFSEVAAIGGGIVQVRASDGWAGLPPDAQRNYVTALQERWATATGSPDHRRVQIVDPGGRTLMDQASLFW